MTVRLLLAAALALVLAGPAIAACPADPGRSVAESRYPQPVRAGDLVGRTVLRPLENQPVVGYVRAVTRRPDGAVDLIVTDGGLLARFGGVWGLGARPVAVPLAELTLLGADLNLMALPAAQFAALPNYSGGDAPVAPDTMLCVGLSKPSH